MRKILLTGFFFLLQLVLALSSPAPARAQAGFEDDRVMLQGFYWESYRHGHPQKFQGYGDKRWYRIVAELAPAMREARFDLLWLPPPSFAGAKADCAEPACPHGAGYNPKEYFNLDNSYGDFGEHRAMLAALLRNGVEPVADIVINHRDGSTGWAGFRNPDWGTWAITRDDEAFTNPASEVAGTPLDRRGAPEEKPDYAGHGGTTYAYDAFRDIDHTEPRVRRDVIRHLLQLKSLGYRGWRYDMVHGYHARWAAVYNRASNPTFSVGEYDWDKLGGQRGWTWHTATTPGRLETASSVFDFMTMFRLKGNKGHYRAWYDGGGGGLIGDVTDGIAWRNRAVTFVENHDTGFRTHEDGRPQEHHESDSFANGWQVEQAYAFVLTHPGVPTVYWKHYFDWGADLREKLRALINARKVVGVHAGSAFHHQRNARASGVYAARVEGRFGDLYVRVGGDDGSWQPARSNYRDYREYAVGAGWKVWVGLPGNPEVRQAPLKAALPVPEYREPRTIEVPDRLLN
jgi:alpha-amylase